MIRYLLTFLLLLTTASPAMAAPPWWESMGKGGSGYEPAIRLKSLHSLGTIRQYSGTFNALVVPVEFTDQALTPGGTAGVGDTSTLEYWQDLFFGDDEIGEGPYPYFSMARYLSDQSGGDFELTGTVNQTVVLKNSAKWYARLVSSGTSVRHDGCFGLGYFDQGGEPKEGGATVVQEEVLQALIDQGVDLSRYMNNTDDILDGIIIIHSGSGAEQSIPTSKCNRNIDDNSDIWSHVMERAISTSNRSYRTKILLAAERFWHPREKTSYPSGIGIIVHEFGHVLDFPDLYDVSGNDSLGAGIYSLMSLGLYDRSADHDNRFGPDIRPKNLDPWIRMKAGWLTEQNIKSNFAFVPLSPSSQTNTIHSFGLGDTPQEFFLAEYRFATGWDADLPASGLLLWHIDENIPIQNSVCIPGPISNCDLSHYMVSVVQADGRWDLEAGISQNGNPGDPNDFFDPGAVIDQSSVPALRNWDETDIGARINVLRYEDKKLLLHLIGDRKALPEAPRIGGLPPVKVGIGSEYVFVPENTEITDLRYQLEQGPAAMEIDRSTGAIRWTPVSRGSYSVRMSVENIAGKDTRSWGILVVDDQSDAAGCSCQIGNGSQVSAIPSAIFTLLLVCGYLGVARLRQEDCDL